MLRRTGPVGSALSADGARLARVDSLWHVPGRVGDTRASRVMVLPTEVFEPSKHYPAVAGIVQAAGRHIVRPRLWPGYPRGVGRSPACRASRTRLKTRHERVSSDPRGNGAGGGSGIPALESVCSWHAGDPTCRAAARHVGCTTRRCKPVMNAYCPNREDGGGGAVGGYANGGVQIGLMASCSSSDMSPCGAIRTGPSGASVGKHGGPRLRCIVQMVSGWFTVWWPRQSGSFRIARAW